MGFDEPGAPADVRVPGVGLELACGKFGTLGGSRAAAKGSAEQSSSESDATYGLPTENGPFLKWGRPLSL